MIFPEETADKIHHCDYAKCAELRRMSVRNKTQFSCSHVQKAQDDIRSGRVASSAVCVSADAVLAKADLLPADARAALAEYVRGVQAFIAVRVTEACYLVR